ncbi:uncharacterized protein NFIA_080970 [Aspergillus fischeri NRRL 181]|uniref:Uncharacterized protein n=1 Tax=Neosartorya fischeri (strain ATCC 1020 / DSM 3700 / CBS 544.65 / FGSC A1164 / JCM 1740 / NRRL 181 / WB 181) TaxID=331117 RepID=A1DFJ6_NEOFI|nr:uncharacterized protein NFIA_080970 [Aspergillus fischeri NRRL 181]EAW18153.1 predicted protein [Aspergillus fischeri NRRL 181]
MSKFCLDEFTVADDTNIIITYYQEPPLRPFPCASALTACTGSTDSHVHNS